jgi:hypothetical protein
MGKVRLRVCLAGIQVMLTCQLILHMSVFLSHGFPSSSLKLPFHQLPFLISQSVHLILYLNVVLLLFIIIGIQPLGWSGQRPELSQASGMAPVRCILG